MYIRLIRSLNTNPRFTLTNYLTVLEKAAITGGVTGLASIVTTGSGWKVPCPTVFGYGSGACPLWIYAIIVGAAASGVSDAVHYLVRHEVPINRKAQDEGSLYLGAIIGALSYYGLMYFSNPYLARDMGAITLMATGMGAEMASSFIYAMIE